MASTPSSDDPANDAGVRKRVGKACDRCRLKKSKCDGSKPCGRCKADNQLCLFGERKKSLDKIYPKGYVELLEHQQNLLVHALQTIYKQCWTAPPLPESENGAPLVHDMLDALGLLQDDKLNSPVCWEGFHFEEEPAKMVASLGDKSESDSVQVISAANSPPSLSPASSQMSLFRDPFTSNGPPTPHDFSSGPPGTSSFQMQAPYPPSLSSSNLNIPPRDVLGSRPLNSQAHRLGPSLDAKLAGDMGAMSGLTFSNQPVPALASLPPSMTMQQPQPQLFNAHSLPSQPTFQPAMPSANGQTLAAENEFFDDTFRNFVDLSS